MQPLSTVPIQPAAARPTNDPVRVVVGLLLMVPAVIGLLIGQVWPTLRTGWLSLRDETFLSTGGGDFVGFENYSEAVNRQSAEGFLFGLTLPLLPLVAVLVVGPLLAYAAHRAGTGGRWTSRLVLAVPMVCFAPAALAAGWAFERGIGEPDSRVALWLTTFGLLAGVGVTVFLAVLRGREPGRSGWPAGLVVGSVAGVATIAVGLQAFAYPIMLGGITAPVPQLYRLGFVVAQLGPAAAQSMLLLVLLLLLGVGATLLVVFSQLRLTVEPTPTRAPVSALAAVGTGLGLLVLLAVTGYGLWPWLTRLGDLDPAFGPSAATVIVNTWLPPLISTVVGVGLAAMAGFGIGALRPLGRWSELLLLLFAPWLFVGIGPLALAKYQAAADGLFGDRIGTFLGLIPPIWVVVPALFVFTLLGKGLADRRRHPDGRPDYPGMLVAALPMVAVLAGATWLIQSQSLLWGLLTARDSDTVTGPVLAVQQGSRLIAEASGLGLVLPIPAIIVFAVGLAVLQIFYLDRLAIRTGRPD
ncbi:MAG: sugar ABC transporter permease [Natronosporangium sp.]